MVDVAVAVEGDVGCGVSDAVGAGRLSVGVGVSLTTGDGVVGVGDEIEVTEGSGVSVGVGVIKITSVLVAVGVGVNEGAAVGVGGVTVNCIHCVVAFDAVASSLASLRIARALSYCSWALHQSPLLANRSPYWINDAR